MTAGSSPAAPVVFEGGQGAKKGTMNLIARPVNFIKEVKAELGKVAWSTREELLASTLVVIVVTLILGIFIGVLDIFLSKLLSLLFK
ncbi:MAG: preprotein translocase subunit SecE [Candidatus Omnitrophota bacterium]